LTIGELRNWKTRASEIRASEPQKAVEMAKIVEAVKK
jgi:hypothetical protein